MAVRNLVLGWAILGAATMAGVNGFSQDMPNTVGETLSGKRIVLADQIRGHAVVLVAGFSHQAGNGTGSWVKAIHADPALASVVVYEIAEIAGAPSLIRGMIKSGMKKGVPPAEQDYFVVLTEDAKPWRSFFEVVDDQLPYVMLLDPSGKILWRGHGSASDLEAQLKGAVH
jgi:ATP10 protein